MKAPNSLSRLLAISYLGAMLAMAVFLAWTARQDETQHPAYSMAEFNAFQVLNNEKDPQTKIKLLDDFVVQYPKSNLLLYIPMEYSQVYSDLRNFPQANTDRLDKIMQNLLSDQQRSYQSQPLPEK